MGVYFFFNVTAHYNYIVNIVISPDLFKYCPKIHIIENGFSACPKLTFIPNGLLDYSPNITNFNYAFAQCDKLGTVPFNLFDKCKNAKTFESTFKWSPNITSKLPDVWNKSKFPNVTNGKGYARDSKLASNYDQIPPEFK